MRNCNKCHIDKDLSEFSPKKNSKDGYNIWCRNCVREYNTQYYKDNTEKIKETTRIYTKTNRNEILSKKREYVRINKERLLVYKHVYYETHKDTMLEQARLYRKTHRAEINKSLKKYKDKTPSYRMAHNLRTRLGMFLKGKTKYYKMEELLGCSFTFFQEYITSLFSEGMGFENYGRWGWHLDHKVPCESFDLTNPEEQKKCFHYTNLQPMWWYDNLSKGSKVI
jgi:hypothetical protein